MDFFTPVVVLASFFVAGLVLAVARPKVAKRITVIFLIVAAVGGLLIYGSAFMTMSDNWLLALLRTVPSVCGMFLGEDNHKDVEELPIMQNGWFHTLFWIIHCYAIYATVSAVVTAVGTKMIRRMQLRFSHRARVCLIYGISNNTIRLGQELAQKKRSVLVYVAENAEAGEKESIEEFSGLVFTNTQALNAEKAFLRNIGCRKNRRITVYAMQEDYSENFHYAKLLLQSLQDRGVPCENTRLVIRAQEQMAVERLQGNGKVYGYGYVSAVDNAMLAARLLTKEYPPCNYLQFDAEGKATDNFEALVIGFGQVGQAVLKSLIMSGQFEGSTFRATVFAPDCLEASGRFNRQFGELREQYHIEMIPENAKSEALYNFLKKQGSTLKYVVICAGNDKLNQELAEDVATYCGWLHLELPMFQCSQRNVKACDSTGVVTQSHFLYQAELLSAELLDRRAMLLNHYYCSEESKTPEQTWMECSYFNRQSSRAAADFAYALIRAAGKSEKEVKTKGWALTEKQKENLSRHEHLRWWAFHACMGYRTMDKETLDARGAVHRAQVEKGEKPIRITKDDVQMLHACMVPWETLPDVGAWESVYTGKQRDYQDTDTQNVLLIPTLLKLEM